MLSFQKLRVYQRSIELLALTIEVIGNLPKGHSDLADQLLRAAQSQPRNIAEGAGRRTAVDHGSPLRACAWLGDGSGRFLGYDARHEAHRRNELRSRHRTPRTDRRDAHEDDLEIQVQGGVQVQVQVQVNVNGSVLRVRLELD